MPRNEESWLILPNKASSIRWAYLSETLEKNSAPAMKRELGSGRNCSRKTGKSAYPHHFCARPIADHTHVSSTSLKNPFDLTEVTIEPNGSVGLNTCERRTLLKGLGGTLALPFLESDAFAKKTPDKEPLRFLVVGNPFGMHPGNFFPMDFG